MKIRSYFLSVVFAGVLLSCSEDDDIPEIPIFKPDATLSFATSVDGVTATLKSAEYDNTEDAYINRLQMILFTGHGENAVFQTDTFIEYATPVTTPVIKDKSVQSGAVSLLVVANHGKYEIGAGTTLSKFLEEVVSLGEEGRTNGYTMSSAVYEYNIVAGKHNWIAFNPDPSGSHLPANEVTTTPVELVRNVSKVNLVKLTLSMDELSDGSTPKEFKVDSIFVSNVKSTSKIASASNVSWGAVEIPLEAEDNAWWFGAFNAKNYNDIFSTVTGSQNDLLLVNVAEDETGLKESLILNKEKTTYPTNSDIKVIGKSFLVYENMNRSSENEVPLGEQTILVICGDYTRTLPNGENVTETNRFYTVPVNNKDYGAGTPSENVGAHQYIKRNVKYNISLTIKSSGSTTPYGKDANAHVSAQVKVAPWRVVNMGGEAD